ncbi:MAG: trans-sulfuration enzyme family protein [Candidatus Dormibacteria bacterium]
MSWRQPLQSRLGMATRVVHGAGFKDLASGAVAPPLVMSATFDHANTGGWVYGREDNPTWALLERAVADLEDATGAVSFGSGMAGVAAVLELVPSGGRVVAARDSYTGTRELLRQLEAAGRCEVDLIDTTDTRAVGRAAAGSALVWLETLGNPLLTIPDLSACAGPIHEAGALMVVDNTFATPILCRPLSLGADLVVHSASKYIGGHDDLILGVVAASDQDLLRRLTDHRTSSGACPGQLGAWLALRGLRTLDVRLTRQMASAQLLAAALRDALGVLRVHYPGLLDHPQHELATRQFEGRHGAMITVELDAGAELAERFCAATRIWTNATSLGSVGSLLERRGRWPGDRYLPAGLVRLSVGVEDPDDLLGDLIQALAEVSIGR